MSASYYVAVEGKTEGPFEGGVLLRMLEAGEVNGETLVSEDGQNWVRLDDLEAVRGPRLKPPVVSGPRPRLQSGLRVPPKVEGVGRLWILIAGGAVVVVGAVVVMGAAYASAIGYKAKVTWEYKVVEIENTEHERRNSVRATPSKPVDVVEEWERSDRRPGEINSYAISSACAGLGSEGWELVSAAVQIETLYPMVDVEMISYNPVRYRQAKMTNMRPGRMTLIFKRPKE